MRKVELAVIGAGPAGLTAATEAARLGMQVTVIDESPEPGGRLRGQLEELPGYREDGGWWRGERIARRLTEEALKAGVTFLNRTSVWGAFPEVGNTPSRTAKIRTIMMPSQKVGMDCPVSVTSIDSRPLSSNGTLTKNSKCICSPGRNNQSRSGTLLPCFIPRLAAITTRTPRPTA
ncbi:MAG: NAD(P)-binding protein [Firmicutes bacterium]|nr:NAD(P)-binding protein [Bacillota bacterium]